jgi:hypothetical protein
MATFTAKNFPKDVLGNEDFSGIGERTVYAPLTKSGIYKWPKGFPVLKDTILTKINKSSMLVSQDTLVHFIYPAKLFRGYDVNQGGAAIYALVSLKSHLSEPDGYLKISSIIKPPGPVQARLAAGMATQGEVYKRIEEISFNKKKNCELVSMALPSSNDTDLVVTIDDKKYNIEIKGYNYPSNPISFCDNLVGRKSVPDIIEKIADVYIKKGDVETKPLKNELKSFGLPLNFLGILDYFRMFDETIGLAGDKGVKSKSGSLQHIFTTEKPSIMTEMRTILLAQFVKNKDNFFVTHNRVDNTFQFYHTGYGDNILDLPKIPEIISFTLGTYGGISNNKTRICMKMRFKQ